jgi:hypothetical protein
MFIRLQISALYEYITPFPPDKHVENKGTSDWILHDLWNKMYE